MNWLTLCPGDPLVDTLTEVFEANLVRVPEARIQPMTVVACRDGKSSFRGELPPLLTGAVDVLTGLVPQQSRMADLSGKRSRQVSINLGLDILDGFLRGFGVTSGAALRQKFDGVAAVSFSFREVNRIFIDIGQLGRALKDLRIDSANPAAAIFFGSDPYDFLLIDSTIVSREFTIQVESKETADFKLDVPAIQEIVAKANARIMVENTSSTSLTFSGSEPLSFAFTCLRFLLDDVGRVMALPPQAGAPLVFGHKTGGASGHVRMGTGLLVWEELG